MCIVAPTIILCKHMKPQILMLNNYQTIESTCMLLTCLISESFKTKQMGNIRVVNIFHCSSYSLHHINMKFQNPVFINTHDIKTYILLTCMYTLSICKGGVIQGMTLQLWFLSIASHLTILCKCIKFQYQ